ncbi:MAG TPA: sigma-70 family RNA polymerase sigma factor [Pirellulales bacterium]|jgi:RNA polymerase sigma-70 factor (ECF subfamily)|nr:sigma-70 family RNA polymerase sigma factor [Pirellulales bacterium]
MSNHLNQLVERLSLGDMSAAELLYAEIAPFLRLVVRRNLPRRLRPKFDSVDVVQSVWANFIEGIQAGRWQFENAAQLRAFLLKSARNRLIDRVRQFRVASEHERSLAPGTATDNWACREPRPSQHAQASDLWQRLLTACPPEHRELLRMKGDGAPLAVIARRTGLHVDSVRRILRQLARQVSQDTAQSEEADAGTAAATRPD